MRMQQCNRCEHYKDPAELAEVIIETPEDSPNPVLHFCERCLERAIDEHVNYHLKILAVNGEPFDDWVGTYDYPGPL